MSFEYVLGLLVALHLFWGIWQQVMISGLSDRIDSLEKCCESQRENLKALAGIVQRLESQQRAPSPADRRRPRWVSDRAAMEIEQQLDEERRQRQPRANH